MLDDDTAVSRIINVLNRPDSKPIKPKTKIQGVHLTEAETKVWQAGVDLARGTGHSWKDVLMALIGAYVEDGRECDGNN